MSKSHKVTAPSPVPVSAHILTWNAAKHLEAALKSVEDCAEILIIDGGSTDETLKLAKRYGATILPQRPQAKQNAPLQDFAAARNVGFIAASFPWIITLDSDEEMSIAMRVEVESIARENAGPAAYLVPRLYVLPGGTVVNHASTYPNERLYFFHRDAVEQWIKPVHERPAVKPGFPIKRLRAGTLAPIGSPEEFYAKTAHYLTIEVEQSRGKGWGEWLVRRVFHTLRSRLIALLRLARIWLLPAKGTRLPWAYERARFWYAWRLVIDTCPLKNR